MKLMMDGATFLLYLKPVKLIRNMRSVHTCRLSSASFSFFSMNSCEIERSLGGEFDIMAGGLSADAGFSITSKAKPPALALGLSKSSQNNTTKLQYFQANK
jgi:hypothetical protein